MNKQDTKKIMFLQTIWFTFLVVSLVACFFACIIFGVNSKNVAHAEDEELRGADTYGYAYNNVLPYNYAHDWTYSLTVSSSNISGAVEFASDDYFSYRLYNGSLTNNSFSNGAYFIIYFKQNITRSTGASYWHFAAGFPGMQYSFNVQYYSYETGQTYSLMSSQNYNRWGHKADNSFLYNTIQAGSYFLIYSGSGITFDWLYFASNSNNYFNGYVSPDYQNYGYNQGYQDGQNSGGGTPDYELISSFGVVYNNLIDNNNCGAWNYQVNVQARNEELRSNRTIYTVYGSGAEDEWTCTMNNASLSNYVYTPQANDSYLLWTYPSSESFTTGYYTFTIGYSGLSSSIQHTGYYIAMQFINSQSRDEPLSVYVELDSTKWYCSVSTEITGIYDTLLLTLDSGSAYGVSGAINLGWLKLEQNEYFSGYVPVSSP